MTQPEPPKHTEITAKVARNVRSALAWKGISARSVTDVLGISSSAVGRRMTGETPIDVADLVIIANMVGLTPGHLIDGEPWPENADVPGVPYPTPPTY
jgi:hypothetical protein